MTEQPGLTATVQAWRLEKRTATGELFEVVEGVGDQPARVTFRREGLAPQESYATGLPFVQEITTQDAAGVAVVVEAK